MIEHVVAGTRMVRIDHDAKERRVGRIISFGASKFRVAWQDGERQVIDKGDCVAAKIARSQCADCGALFNHASIPGEAARCTDCGSTSHAASVTASEIGWDGEFPVELAYTQGMKSDRKRKVFKTKAELDKWIEKNGDDITVDAWSADFERSASTMPIGSHVMTTVSGTTSTTPLVQWTVSTPKTAAPDDPAIADVDPLMMQLLDEEGYDYGDPDIIPAGTDGMGSSRGGGAALGLGGTHFLLQAYGQGGSWLYYKGWERHAELVARIRDWDLYQYDYAPMDDDSDAAFSMATVRDPEKAKRFAALRSKIAG